MCTACSVETAQRLNIPNKMELILFAENLGGWKRWLLIQLRRRAWMRQNWYRGCGGYYFRRLGEGDE